MKWIDVKERLPQEGVFVAVFYGTKESDGVDVGMVQHGKWFLRSLKPESHCGFWKVLKWYPLPDLPDTWSF